MASLPRDIIEFEQLKEESIGATWARFRRLCASRPSSFLLDDVLLYAFCMSIDMDCAQDLDSAAGGSFAHKTLVEGRANLHNLEKSFFSTDHNKPHQESDSIHESLSTAELEPTVSTSQDSSVEPSLKPGTMEEEEIQPLEFLYQFKDNPLENLRNTSNCLDVQLGKEPSSVQIQPTRNLLPEPSPSLRYLHCLPVLQTKHL
jgi:hypothetical protein